MESKTLRFMTHQSIFSMVGSGDLDGLKKLVEELKKEDNDNGSSSSSSSMLVSDLMCLQNEHGETTLYIAAERNLKQVFSFLLQLCDFEVLKIRSKSDMNAFHVAAKRGNLGIHSTYSLFYFLLWVGYAGYCYYWVNCVL